MLLKIKHETNYYYSSNVPNCTISKTFSIKVQNQKIFDWKIYSNIGIIEESHQDSLGHKIQHI